jgi:hypothetical protein
VSFLIQPFYTWTRSYISGQRHRVVLGDLVAGYKHLVRRRFDAGIFLLDRLRVGDGFAGGPGGQWLLARYCLGLTEAINDKSYGSSKYSMIQVMLSLPFVKKVTVAKN